MNAREGKHFLSTLKRYERRHLLDTNICGVACVIFLTKSSLLSLQSVEVPEGSLVLIDP